jgi:hypothetical protein
MGWARCAGVVVLGMGFVLALPTFLSESARNGPEDPPRVARATAHG